MSLRLSSRTEGRLLQMWCLVLLMLLCVRHQWVVQAQSSSGALTTLSVATFSDPACTLPLPDLTLGPITVSSASLGSRARTNASGGALGTLPLQTWGQQPVGQHDCDLSAVYVSLSTWSVSSVCPNPVIPYGYSSLIVSGQQPCSPCSLYLQQPNNQSTTRTQISAALTAAAASFNQAVSPLQRALLSALLLLLALL